MRTAGAGPCPAPGSAPLPSLGPARKRLQPRRTEGDLVNRIRNWLHGPAFFCFAFFVAALAFGQGVTKDIPPALRVCADPDNLPFSDREEQGFENKIAALIAGDLGMTVSYFWWPHRRGFLRNTLRARECDVLMACRRASTPSSPRGRTTAHHISSSPASI